MMVVWFHIQTHHITQSAIELYQRQSIEQHKCNRQDNSFETFLEGRLQGSKVLQLNVLHAQKKLDSGNSSRLTASKLVVKRAQKSSSEYERTPRLNTHPPKILQKGKTGH